MNLDVLLLGQVQIDTDTFLAAAQQTLGRSLSQKIDAQGKDATSTPGYLALLAAMKDDSIKWNTLLENPGYLLQHCFYSFLVVCDKTTLDELIYQTRLAIQSTDCNGNLFLAVISGTLESWRTSVINCCSEASGFNVRFLFDKILLLFEREGLSKIWSEYTKKTLKDKTFLLLERK